ncbi:vacuolar ATP synthase [Musa troglodytarum]|uniref:Vacuolar ATP synthase n=1 Tax=Musa troglodytarum TaxID=320322 RepID=A0A9E7I7D7_9LILI|nr:vacuolar ATP synthase [Musa troglodytarum]
MYICIYIKFEENDLCIYFGVYKLKSICVAAVTTLLEGVDVDKRPSSARWRTPAGSQPTTKRAKRMATAFADQFFRPVPAGLRRPPAALKPAGTFLLLRRPPAGPVTRSAGPRRGCAAKSESVEKVGADLKDLVEFLYADLPHLFDEQGIDRTMYDDRVRFRDPITGHDTIDGYLFNIRLLKLLFRPDFYLHHVRQTGPNEITTRWTMVMRFTLLPWQPELLFTGTSVMGVCCRRRQEMQRGDVLRISETTWCCVGAMEVGGLFGRGDGRVQWCREEGEEGRVGGGCFGKWRVDEGGCVGAGGWWLFWKVESGRGGMSGGGRRMEKEGQRGGVRRHLLHPPPPAPIPHPSSFTHPP